MRRLKAIKRGFRYFDGLPCRRSCADVIIEDAALGRGGLFISRHINRAESNAERAAKYAYRQVSIMRLMAAAVRWALSFRSSMVAASAIIEAGAKPSRCRLPRPAYLIRELGIKIELSQRRKCFIAAAAEASLAGIR